MKCIKCGAENGDTNLFCSNCGEKLEDMVCKNCQTPITNITKFCGNCGEKNPYYTDINTSFSPPNKSNVGVNNIDNKFKINGKLFLFIAIIIFSFLALIVSFGSITNTNTYEWNYNNGDYYFVDFSFKQSAIQIYSGYFTVLTLTNEDKISDYHDLIIDEYFEGLNDYGSEITSSEYERLHSNINFFGFTMSFSINPNNTFISSLDYFIMIFTLLMIQLIPLVIVIITIIKYIKQKSLASIKNLFLIGAILGVLLTFFLPNLIINQTGAGTGLIAYIIIMFLSFGALHFNDIFKQKKLKYLFKPFYLVDIIIISLLLIIISNSFIKIGYEESSVKTIWGSFQNNEIITLVNVFDNDFEYSSSWNYYYLQSPDFADGDLTSFDKENLANMTDYSYLFRYTLFDSISTQNIFILSLIISIILLVSMTLLLFFSIIKCWEYPSNIKILILKFLSIIFFIIVLILSIIFTTKINQTFYKVDEPFIAKIPISIILGIILSFISMMLSLISMIFRNNILLKTDTTTN